MKRIGHAGFGGAVGTLMLGRLIGTGLDPGPLWAGLLVLGLMVLGAVGGALAYTVILKRRSVELCVDGRHLDVLRGGELIERYALSDLEVECFGDPYARADDGRFWLGATLTLAGRRTIDVRTAARRSELDGLRQAQTGGLLLSHRSFRALVAAVHGGRRTTDALPEQAPA
jgi:hypothetical protein